MKKQAPIRANVVVLKQMLNLIPPGVINFDAVHRINRAADADPGTIRLSIDTKTTVAIGNLSRGGKSRQAPAALDHDLEPEAKLTPFGIHRPESAETWLCFTTGSATADFMADRLNEIWPTLKKRSFSTYPRHQRRQRPGKQRTAYPVAQATHRVQRRAPRDRAGWRAIRPITANTTRSSGSSEFWKTTGTATRYSPSITPWAWQQA